MKNRRQERQEQATTRQAKYDALSLAEKIARAKTRRGESKKELQRLREQHQGAV